MTDILKKAPGVFYTIEHLSKLLTNKKFWSPTSDLYVFLQKLSLAVAFLINFLIFFLFRKKLSIGTSVDDPYFD